MSIAFDNAIASTTATTSFTTTGSNLIVFDSCYAINTSVNSATYAGDALTSLGLVVRTNNEGTWAGYKLGATSGTNNMVLSDNQSVFRQSMASYTGVGGSVTTLDSGSFTGTTFTKSVNTTVANSWLVWISFTDNLVSFSTGTRRVSSAFDQVVIGDLSTTTTGSYSFIGTIATSNTNGCAYRILQIEPFVAPSANGNFFTII